MRHRSSGEISVPGMFGFVPMPSAGPVGGKERTPRRPPPWAAAAPSPRVGGAHERAHPPRPWREMIVPTAPPWSQQHRAASFEAPNTRRALVTRPRGSPRSDASPGRRAADGPVSLYCASARASARGPGSTRRPIPAFERGDPGARRASFAANTRSSSPRTAGTIPRHARERIARSSRRILRFSGSGSGGSFTRSMKRRGTSRPTAIRACGPRC